MSHARQQIRDQVATLLNVPLPNRVFVNPFEALAEDQIPAAVVTTPDETIENLLNKREHTLTVQVEGVAIGANAIDDLAVTIETTLDDSSLVGGLVTDWYLQSTQIVFVRDQAKQKGSAKLTFTCKYMTSMSDPTVIV